MPDLALAERMPLAHCVVQGRHGRSEGEAGVTLTVLTNLGLTMLIARKGRLANAHRLAAAEGLALPDRGRSTAADGVRVLWAGPDQWLVVAEPRGQATAERLVSVCTGCCMAVDQSDARAVISVSGPDARQTLAKGVPIDLHPRAFEPGSTALTGAAGVTIQIWQMDEAPTFLIALPLSFSEGFWTWLLHAAAEYGVRALASA